MVPADETLKPLVEALHISAQKLDRLQKIEQDLADQSQQAAYKLEQVHNYLQRLREQIAEQEQHNEHIQRAINTQRLLAEYSQELSREKISLLEKALSTRFNELCHKESLLDAVKIEPESFKITLYRRQQAFARSQLSAGEKQLMAVAIMWALREVSGIPMPVIIDTPLGRLDMQHRLNMIQDYFPHASHQVILLATDAEIDETMFNTLRPAISHDHHLGY